MKKTIRIAALAFALLGLSQAALAQMGGRGPQAGGNGNGPGAGTGVGHVLVAPDGKAIFAKRTTTTSGSTTTTTTQLVAVGTSGSVAWTFTPPAEIRDIVLPTGLVVLNAASAPTSTAAGTSQLVALNLASGAQAWSVAVDGMLNDLQATSSGLLAVVSKTTAAASTDTQAAVAHTLVSYTLSGTVAWSLALD